MGLLGVSEAADVLGVTGRRVRQLLGHGVLVGCKVSGVWVVDVEDLERFRGRARGVGRPWSSVSVWALLSVADGDGDGLSGSQRARASRRLEAGLERWLPRLGSRCVVHRFYGHPSALRSLGSEMGVVRSGVSAAGCYGAGLVGPSEFEGYVRVSDLETVVARSGLSGDATGCPNVVLRAVEDRVWPFRSGVRVASLPVVAVDLLEASDQRSRRAGRELLLKLSAR